LSSLLAKYQKPEDLIGENGLLKQLTKLLVTAKGSIWLWIQPVGATRVGLWRGVPKLSRTRRRSGELAALLQLAPSSQWHWQRIVPMTRLQSANNLLTVHS